MLSRRELLTTAARAGAALALPLPTRAADEGGVEVNDVQSQLNATRVRSVVRPTSVDDVAAAVRNARRDGRAVCVAGGRHAMGGQQFARDAVLLDTTSFNRVLAFDREKGLVTAEAGIEWPELIDYLVRAQAGAERPWAIREKQTGVDR